MITRQLFQHMLEREKILEKKLKTLERENAELKRGKPLRQPPNSASRASVKTDTRLTLAHDAEFNTRKVYD